VRADFVVDAALVSRVHCRVSARRDGRLEVQDLESTNGTFVNGKKVDHAELKDGDELGVGRVTLKVEKVH
jgi:pSer/pThr/pTyr-binding forkhead associated (FHA) protein